MAPAQRDELTTEEQQALKYQEFDDWVESAKALLGEVFHPSSKAAA